jgi:putative acetyltransferase
LSAGTTCDDEEEVDVAMEDILIGVRVEESSDEVEVFMLHEAAFGREDEAQLVEKLRGRPTFDPSLSFVMFQGQRILGHVLYTPVWIVKDADRNEMFGALALAPVAILPEEQRGGLGTDLIKDTLERVKEEGHNMVLVVGDPKFYGRFGFVPAVAKGISNDIGVPDPYFMVLELVEGALEGVTGELRYPQPFKEFK